MFASIAGALAGYKTYIACAVVLGGVFAEKVMGVDVPGLTVGDDWLGWVLGSIGGMSMRAAIDRR